MVFPGHTSTVQVHTWHVWRCHVSRVTCTDPTLLQTLEPDTVLLDTNQTAVITIGVRLH